MYNLWPVELLGRFATDSAVVDALVRHGIDTHPSPGMPPDDARPQWLLGSPAGVEFGFEFEPATQGAPDANSAQLQLSQVYLYGKHPHVAPYGGPLPFGLALSDARATVRAKLAVANATCRAYQRDAWDMGHYTLVVAYTDEGACIDFLLFLQPAYLPTPASLDQRATMPSLDAIVRTFGQSLAGNAVEKLFAALGWQRWSAAARNGGLVSLRQRQGLDVIGRAASASTPGVEKSRATGNVLTEVVLHRPGCLASAGWMGELPFNLQWNDSPAVLTDRVPKPDDMYEGEFAGWILKHEPYASVQVHYSTMENFIVQVRMLAPGVWPKLSSG